jgi:hypothetical protein
MILIYKSCIFCDTIFDASVPHICNICEEESKNKIDIDPHPPITNEETEQNIIMDENKKLIKRTIITRKNSRTASRPLKEEAESTDEDDTTIPTNSNVYNFRTTNNKVGYGILKKKKTHTYTHTHIPSQIELYEQ